MREIKHPPRLMLECHRRLRYSETAWKKSLCNLFEALAGMIRSHVIKRNRYIQLGERQHTGGEALPWHGRILQRRIIARKEHCARIESDRRAWHVAQGARLAQLSETRRSWLR